MEDGSTQTSTPGVGEVCLGTYRLMYFIQMIINIVIFKNFGVMSGVLHRILLCESPVRLKKNYISFEITGVARLPSFQLNIHFQNTT